VRAWNIDPITVVNTWTTTQIRLVGQGFDEISSEGKQQ